jgi:RNA polymerase sigma factor (TIGR02999 family)
MNLAEESGGPDISTLLAAWARGDEGALPQLAPLVYQQLRLIARHQARAAKSDTLQPTGLVHEVYLRLVRTGGLRVEDRSHFFAIAAQMMRHIVIDAARARVARKRQGAWLRVTLGPSLVGDPQDRNLVALDDALAALAKLDARKARIVELRYFTGLDVAETAAVLGISQQTVQRGWRMAKSWLAREMAAR